MKKQTDYDMYEIQRYGCYFCSLLEMAERTAQKRLTDEQVYNLYQIYVLEGFMSRKCYIYKPDEILQTALSALSHRRRIFQIGMAAAPLYFADYWRWVKTKLQKPSFHIYKTLTANGNNHFILADDSMRLIYNPDPTIKLLKTEAIVHYRIYE
jgi:hypothetical protein